MKFPAIMQNICGKHRYATADDIRNTFGDYHNALHWFAVFLMGDEKLAAACIVDACTIAETRSPVFHEWLVQWAARATVRCALQKQRALITDVVTEYEKSGQGETERPPLSAERFRLLIEYAEDIRVRLDVLCRFVLVLRGVAKDSLETVAAQLAIGESAVERAYCVAFDTLDALQRDAMQGRCSDSALALNHEPTLAGLTGCDRDSQRSTR